MKIIPWRPSPVVRRRALNCGALCLALGGTGFLGWALGTCRRAAGAAPVAASATHTAEPSEAAPAAAKAEPAKETPPASQRKTGDAPPIAEKASDAVGKAAAATDATAKGPAPAPSVSAAPRPKGTRGTDAIVRWNTPLAEGLRLLENGHAAEALNWSQEHASTGGAALILKGRALLALGRYEEARGCFADQANAPLAADAAFGLALCDAEGKAEAIPAERLEALIDSKDANWGVGMAACTYALHLPDRALLNGERVGDSLAKGEELERHYLQKALLTESLPAPTEQACLKRLNELTARIILNPRRAHLLDMPKAARHKVAPGESLTSLGKQYDVNIGRICRLNGLSARGVLIAGKTVKVIQGTALVKVDRWRLTATLLIDGVFIRRYPVGLGPDDKTPSGAFTIRKKVLNPDWYYEGKRIPAGNPENILGTRWLGFDADENGGRGAGLGIHGTTLPESVPGRESKGCIRMLNADVEELYDWVPQGTVVEIN
jgi:LysM repeat protein